MRGLGKDNDSVLFTIDKQNGYAKIEGDKILKEILYDMSTYVLKRWRKMKMIKRQEEPEMLRVAWKHCLLYDMFQDKD